METTPSSPASASASDLCFERLQLPRDLGRVRGLDDHLAVVLRIAREDHDRLREAHSLHNLSNLYYHNRDLAKALELVQEGLELYRSLDHVSGMAFALSMQATIAFDLGQPE